MTLVWQLGKKALVAGSSIVGPVAAKVVDVVGDTPTGPVLGKAMEAGERALSPFVSLVRPSEPSEGTPTGGLEDRGTPAVSEERVVDLAPPEDPLMDLPLPAYETMEIAAILDALNGLTVRQLQTVRTYEAAHDERLPIIERINELLASVDAPI